MRMRLLGTIALSTLLATGLAACGDDDGGGGGGGEALELEDVPAGDGGRDDDDSDDADDTTTTTAGDETADTSGDDDGPLFGDLGGEDCDLLLEATTALGEAFSGGGSDVDFGEIATAYAEIAANAPGEIAADAAILAEAFGQFATAMEGVDLNDPSTFQDPEVAQRIAEASQIFSDPAFNEANTNFTTFLTTECTGG